MKKCINCECEFDLPYRKKFCSRKCKDKKDYVQSYEKLLKDPERRNILIERLMKRRVKNGIPIDLPIKNVAPKGSGCLAKSGYKFIHKKGHPNANKQGSLAEHVYVMSENIGRPIKKQESVHHKNGIRDDNRIENLELWCKSQPSGQRLEDKIKYSIELLQSYGYKIINP